MHTLTYLTQWKVINQHDIKTRNI